MSSQCRYSGDYPTRDSFLSKDVRLPSNAEDKSLIDLELDYFKKVTLIRPNLLAFCRSIIFDWSEAEDVCQNSLLILTNKESDYDASRSFHGWAFSICRYQIQGYLKREKRSRTKPCGMGEDYFDCSVFDDSMIGESFEKRVDITVNDDGVGEVSEFNPSIINVNERDNDLQLYQPKAQRRNFEFDTYSSKAGSIKHLNNVIPKTFLNTDTDQLLRLLRLNLNKRELKIFDLLKIGYTNQEVGKILKLKTSAMNIAKRRLLIKLRNKLSAIQKFNKYDYQESPI